MDEGRSEILRWHCSWRVTSNTGKPLKALRVLFHVPGESPDASQSVHHEEGFGHTEMRYGMRLDQTLSLENKQTKNTWLSSPWSPTSAWTSGNCQKQIWWVSPSGSMSHTHSLSLPLPGSQLPQEVSLTLRAGYTKLKHSEIKTQEAAKIPILKLKNLEEMNFWKQFHFSNTCWHGMKQDT